MASKPKSDSYKRYCCVYGCLNKRKNKESESLTFFKIPDDKARRQKWLTAIDREDLLDEEHKVKHNYVCAAHFDESAIITSTLKRLKSDAAPSKLLPLEIIPSDTRDLINNEIEIPKVTFPSKQTNIIETSNKFTQTALAFTDKFPLKRKLKQELVTSESKRRQLEQHNLRIEKELESNKTSLFSNPEDVVAQKLNKLVEWRNELKNKFKGNHYDTPFKMFALNLHYASPHAYRCLKTVLKLPSKSALNRIKLNMPPKFDDRVLNSLSLKIKSLPKNAKYCTICVDEMKLKRNLYYDTKKDEVTGFHSINGTISSEIATNAYVIMLQGIYCNWKQPIAYAFSGSIKHYAELDSWINEVISKLFGVGIEVKALISNQKSTFDKYVRVIKKVTVEKPYFFVEEHKIFFIFDVPHLIKCVRNDLLSSILYYNEDVMYWDHVKSLYEHQKDKNLRLIPKITNAHVEPNNFQRKRVKYATQIFSNTVSTALETYIDFGKISEEARGTAKFIKSMNDLFDVLNSSKIKSAKKYQVAFKMTSEQKNILLSAQQMFASIKSKNLNTKKNNTNQIKTFHNFQITIESVLQLFEELKSEGFMSLFTRRLNQDSLDFFFGAIRRQCGSCSEPTPIQFIRAFSKLFFVEMLKSENSNCESDIYDILLKAEDIINKESSNPHEQVRPTLVALNGDIDYRIDLPEANALTYVAGFLLYKCTKKHLNCDKYTEIFNASPNMKLSHYKAYNKSKSFHGNLKMPSDDMNDYVEKLEIAFENNFKHQINKNPGSEIFKLLQKIPLPKLPCLCFPVDYLLRLFVRLRIFSTIRFNNRNFKSGKPSIKQYLEVKQLL